MKNIFAANLYYLLKFCEGNIKCYIFEIYYQFYVWRGTVLSRHFKS